MRYSVKITNIGECGDGITHSVDGLVAVQFRHGTQRVNRSYPIAAITEEKVVETLQRNIGEPLGLVGWALVEVNATEVVAEPISSESANITATISVMTN